MRKLLISSKFYVKLKIFDSWFVNKTKNQYINKVNKKSKLVLQTYNNDKNLIST